MPRCIVIWIWFHCKLWYLPMNRRNPQDFYSLHVWKKVYFIETGFLSKILLFSSVSKRNPVGSDNAARVIRRYFGSYNSVLLDYRVQFKTNAWFQYYSLIAFSSGLVLFSLIYNQRSKLFHFQVILNLFIFANA